MYKKLFISFPLLLSACGPAIVGGVGNVGLSAVEERGFSGYASDQAIDLKIDHEFSGDLAAFSGIEITVYNGRVLLTGVVGNEKIKKDAIGLAKNVSGVKEVIDGMNIMGKDGLSEYTRDGWMTTKLKASLYADEDVFAPNYLVRTFDKIIYIFGTAQTKEEMKKVTDYAYDITGVRKVVNLIEIAKIPQMSQAPQVTPPCKVR